MKTKDQIKIITNHQKLLSDRFHSQTTTIAQLTAAGCIDAKEYWKDGKYLYFLYAMKNGSRKKKYIGNHPLRIEEARKKIKNHKLRFSAIQTQDTIRVEMDEIQFLLNRILRICSITNMNALLALDDSTNGYTHQVDLENNCTQIEHL